MRRAITDLPKSGDEVLTDGPLKIAPVEAADIDALAVLAREIWHAHYAAIISLAQIEYMLEQRYAPAILRRELRLEGLWWDKLVAGGKMAGFASYYLTGVPGEMKIDKLYVHPLYQRRGYGKAMIERAHQVALVRGCDRLVLAVNRNNAIAIAAYLKHGFRVAGAAVKDIGGGFVMDDYLMERTVRD